MKVNLLVLGLLLLSNFFSYAQTKVGNKNQEIHHEVIDDGYVPVDKSKMRRSPAYIYHSKNKEIEFFTTQVNIDINGDNIIGDAANETSIAVDPVNPDRMVIGWRQFDIVTNNFRQAGNAYTMDGGDTWTNQEVIDPGIFRSDPVLDFDKNGNFYYNSLTKDEYGNYHCDVFRIVDGGNTWDEGVYAQGGDKQWMRIDRTDGIGSGNNYSFWTAYWSSCYPGSMTRSIDNGNTYEDCVVVNGEPRWGTLAVGKNGTLYIVGEASSDMLLLQSSTAQDPSNPVTWTNATVVDLDGELSGWAPINPAGLVGQAWVDTDISDGPGSGNIYALASVERFSNTDPADVMFARSTNGGLSFEDPIKINDDVSISNYNWFGTLSVAPNGRIDVVWLDTRDAPIGSQYMSALYYSYSIDQGETWSTNVKLSDSFDPHIGWPDQEKMEDYFDMVSDNTSANLAWANTLNGEQDAYYARIIPNPTYVNDLEKSILNIEVFPNPFINETIISFCLNQDLKVGIEVFDLLGQKVKCLSNTNFSKGEHQMIWDGTNDLGNSLSSGFYFIDVRFGEYHTTKKILLR